MEMLDPLNRKISFFIEVRMFEQTILFVYQDTFLQSGRCS